MNKMNNEIKGNNMVKVCKYNREKSQDLKEKTKQSKPHIISLGDNKNRNTGVRTTG